MKEIRIRVGLYVTEDNRNVFHLVHNGRSLWLSDKMEKLNRPPKLDGMHIIDEIPYDGDYVTIVSK